MSLGPARSGWVLAALVLLLAAGATGWTLVELRRPRSLAGLAYAGSASCRSCHPDHSESWRRTFHRTMTQVATAQTVLGDFGDQTQQFEGVRSRMTRDGDGFWMETLGADGAPTRLRIERTVGSRRVQQYLAREGDHFVRLPIAWSIAERRWFHLNGGFLDPDGAGFNLHRAVWDGNCIFCHNVKARPGYDWQTARFASSVAELGIACEACHGPASEHVWRNKSPLRRALLRLTGWRDATVVDPKALDPRRQTQICGHCHGQRVPSPVSKIRTFLSDGDPYTPGEDLSEVTAPLFAQTQVEGLDVAARFWADGTPRLTAYEYQGLLLSTAHVEAGLTCESCHAMHRGDPRGMIEPAMRGPAACVRCHPAIVAAGPAHTGHRAGSSGGDCFACHLPKLAYGLMEVHRTHRIQRPDPSRAWRFEMPEACTLCHLDQTARWAAEQTARLWRTPAPEGPPPEPRFAIAESVRTVLGGDVVQRATAAMALGEAGADGGDPLAQLWVVPILLRTMEDGYPSVRHFAQRSLEQVVARARTAHPALGLAPPSEPFDPQGTPAARARVIAAWRAGWAGLDKRGIPRPGRAVPLGPELQPLPGQFEALARRGPERVVSLGE